jgi:hypothetical protein
METTGRPHPDSPTPVPSHTAAPGEAASTVAPLTTVAPGYRALPSLAILTAQMSSMIVDEWYELLSAGAVHRK